MQASNSLDVESAHLPHLRRCVIGGRQGPRRCSRPAQASGPQCAVEGMAVRRGESGWLSSRPGSWRCVTSGLPRLVKNPRIFGEENLSPCTFVIVPGSVAIAYRSHHRR
jgi:hypothetical protein